jgi:phosphoribosylformimino-5-aminoimidazole carboxamide ribotide isomerase
MQIIPVIDLKEGVVVRARLGERSAYRPIETPLSPTAAPVDVVAGVLSLFPFPLLYAADLDAIEARGDNGPAISHIATRFPDLKLWVDNGCADMQSAHRFLDVHPNASLVLGSESQRDCEVVRTVRHDPRVILSLDFRGNRFLGPDCLLAEPGLWPERVIIMTLARVGSGAGPDFERFAEIGRRAAGRRLYLAGGLRDAADLSRVKASGAAGILVASALHDGRITARDLAASA